MSSFGDLLDTVRSYTITFFRTLPFLWLAAPCETVFLVAAILLQGQAKPR
jgi:hypothetical protein